MVTSIRSRWQAGGAVLLIISALWAQSRGTSEDESAVRALIEGADGDNKNATKARQYAVECGLDGIRSGNAYTAGRLSFTRSSIELAHSTFLPSG